MPANLRGVAATIFALSAGASPVAAQLTAANFLTKMETVAAYPLVPLFRSNSSVVGAGYGLEISFGIGEWARPMTKAERVDRCKNEEAAAKKDSTAAAPKPATTCDSSVTFTATSVPVQIRSSNGVADTTFTYTQTPLTVRKMSFELTVAQKVTYLRSDNVVPGWQLSGRVLEYPTFALYGTIGPDWDVSPYLGLTFIPGALSGAKFSRGDTTATVESSAIGSGVSVGGVTQWEIFNLFAELEYTKLLFNTSNWTRSAPFTTPLPPRINISGVRFSLGFLVSFKTS